MSRQWHSIASLRQAASSLVHQWNDSPAQLLRGEFVCEDALPSLGRSSTTAAAVELLMQHHPQGLSIVREWRAAVLKQKASSSQASIEDQHTLKEQDAALQRALTTAFGRSFLSLQRISLTSPGYLLDFLAATEKVHPAKTFLPLKQKLGQKRRVLALTQSPRADGLPSAIIHAALTPSIAHSMAYLNTHTGSEEHILQGAAASHPGLQYPPPPAPTSEPTPPAVANFYSVAVTDPALKGTGLATTLIFEAAAALQAEHPSLRRFVTLSPVPLFMQWLAATATRVAELPADAPAADVAAMLAGSTSTPVPTLLASQFDTAASTGERLQQLRSLAASAGEVEHSPRGAADTGSEEVAHFHRLQWRERVLQSQGDLLRLLRWYIAFAKHPSGRPHCPTAAFHLSNGATLRCVNFMGNLSPQGMRESGSLMVNYEYELAEVAARAAAFHADSAVVTRELWEAQWQPRDDADTALIRS